MILGKVIGTVWSTKKDESLEGSKFMLVKQLKSEFEETENLIVAVDTVGSGVGETVIVTTGQPSENTVVTRNKPVDAVIIGIIDKLDIPEKPDVIL